MLQLVSAIAFGIFTALMVWIGIATHKHAKTMSGFLLGGRKMGPWMSAFAYGTTYFSAVIFIGYAGNTGWQVGIGGLWIGIGNAILGCLLAWLVLAKRTRNMTHTLNASTMPEFFEARYQSKGMKIYSAIIIFVFLVPYCATVYKGLGYLFAQVFPNLGNLIPGIDTEVYIMFIIALLTSVYLVLGGYVATAVSDFVQGIIMIFGVVVMVIAIVSRPEVGGLANGLAQLREINPALVSVTGGKMWSFLVMNVLLTSFGTWGLPQMIHKYYAVKDDKSIFRAAVISTIFATVIGVSAYLTGTFGRLYLNNTLPTGNNYDAVVPNMLMLALSEGIWYNILFSIILLLVLSASMSTLSSIVLTSSSALSVDLLAEIKPDYDKKKQMIFMRWLCFIFVAASFLFASMKIAFILQLMSFSWGVVSGCFIGPYFWGLYSKKITKAGAWAGILSGTVIVGGATIFYTITQGFNAARTLSTTFGVIAMIVSFIITPLVSAFTKKFSDEHIQKVYSEQ